MRKILIGVFLFSALYSQVFDKLYIPDSLGGCGDLDGFIFNPVMNRVYVWSDKADNIGVLDCATNERLSPIYNIPPDAQHLTSSSFAYNPNNNCLYEASNRENSRLNTDLMGKLIRDSLPFMLQIDSFLFVIDCSTQAIIDTITINSDGRLFAYFDVNVPADKIYLGIDSTFVIDANTNQVIKKIRRFDKMLQHKIRKVAYGLNIGYMTNTPLYIIDCENDTIADSIPLPPSSDYDKAFIVSEIERLFVVRESLLVIINCTNNSILAELQIPAAPYQIYSFTYNSINNKLYVSAGKTYIIDLNTNQITDSLDLSAYYVYNPNSNHLYALRGQIRSISVLDGATNQIIDEIPIPYPPYLNRDFNFYVFNTTFNKLYLDDADNVFIIDCNQRRLEKGFKMGYENQHIMWQPVTNRLYINDVCHDTFSSILTVYDASTNRPLKVLNFSQSVPSGERFWHFTTATQVNKIYLTSGQSLGIYVLDGNTDSLINFIPCDVGGHYLLYNPNQNKLYTIPFTDFSFVGIYIIDCQTDEIRNLIDVGETGNGYFNPYNNRVYATISYEGGEFKVFTIDGVGDTVIKVLDSLGLPLAFRNKENIHQVYIGSSFKNCIYVLNADNDSLIDSVMNVPVRAFDDQFFYYDSVDDRIYFPKEFGVLVIDCTNNIVMDSIIFPGYPMQEWFPENYFWNPASDRFYVPGRHSWLFPVYIIDCQTNTIIDSCTDLLSPTIMQWNSTNNVIYVNDHLCGKVVAINDDLIGITETKNIETSNSLLIYPTIGNKFILRRKAEGEMRIYDVCGRVVRKVKQEETMIDGKRLTLGVYFLRVVKPENKNIQKFIVVR
jgi:DNA-binding beta-propeller fold protein YncE